MRGFITGAIVLAAAGLLFARDAVTDELLVGIATITVQIE